MYRGRPFFMPIGQMFRPLFRLPGVLSTDNKKGTFLVPNQHVSIVFR